MPPSIHDYITQQENAFETEQIKVGDNWYWNFRNHVQLIFHLKNGMFFTGENDWLRAFKNIMEPILDLCYWTEDIDVKDVTFWIESQTGKALSFLIKKYHDEVYTHEHDLDTMFDEITESDIDYGGVLVQKGVERPEVLALNSVAFCDQTDLMGGPSGLKFFFSPDKLRGMAKFGWGKESNGATTTIEDLIVLATFDKETTGIMGQKNQTPGKNIEVYIVRGNLPEDYLEDNDNVDDYYNQLQIVAKYVDNKGDKQGVTLYRKKEGEGNLKFFTSKKIYQRALGRGIGERLVGPQIWTNFLTIHKTSLLEAASKIPLYTDDPSYSTKNKIQDMENLEITVIEDGKGIHQVPTAAPANIQLYERDINDWYQHAQLTGSAFDPIMGVQPASGTTFRGQERTVAQGRGSHDKRRGQRAKFIEEIYRDWIIPSMVKEINQGKEFMATLSNEELTWVADQIATNEVNKRVKELILSGKMVTKQEQDTFIQIFKADFFKKGNKHLLKALKNEFDDIAIRIGINVAGKQKNLADLSDKMLSIFQFVFANPGAFQQAMQIPALAKSFENILEVGGLSIGDFSSLLQTPPPAPIQPSQPSQQAPQQTPQLLAKQPA